jgi:hypothetical protein
MNATAVVLQSPEHLVLSELALVERANAGLSGHGLSAGAGL